MLQKFTYLAGFSFIASVLIGSASYAMHEDSTEHRSSSIPLHLDEDIKKDFTTFVQSFPGTPEGTFHHIQAQDIETTLYNFHYTHQDSYNRNIETPEYPRYEPEGEIKVTRIGRTETDIFLTSEWLLKNNPTPGIHTPFRMDFDVYPKSTSSS